MVQRVVRGAEEHQVAGVVMTEVAAVIDVVDLEVAARAAAGHRALMVEAAEDEAARRLGDRGRGLGRRVALERTDVHGVALRLGGRTGRDRDL